MEITKETIKILPAVLKDYPDVMYSEPPAYEKYVMEHVCKVLDSGHEVTFVIEELLYSDSCGCTNYKAGMQLLKNKLTEIKSAYSQVHLQSH